LSYNTGAEKTEKEKLMRNIFERSVPRFEAPNQPVEPEGAAYLYEQKTEKQTQDATHKARPFDKHDVLEFATHPLMKENDRLRMAREKEEQKQALSELFQSGDLNNIENFLLDEKMDNKAMQQETERVKKEYATELSGATFLIEKDWRILTALEIFDKGTFEHCVRTYTFAKEILETKLVGLGKEIEQEGVILKQFYIACLFHDLGKLSIPKFILNSRVSDEIWTYLFMTELSPEQQDDILTNHEPPIPVPDAYRGDYTKLHEFLNNNKFRAVSFVPTNKAFNNPEELKAFAERGIDGNLPLMKIIEPHEKESKNMLKKLGYGLEALLAGHHHNYESSENQNVETPVSTSALQVMVELSSDIIHTIDVYDAMTSHRSYQSGDFSILDIFSSIIQHAEDGKIKNRWVAATIINEKLKEDNTFDSSQESKVLQNIEIFLKENLRDDEICYFK